MSSRVLKKLHGEPDLNIREEDDDDLSDVDIEPGHGGVGGAAGAARKQLNVNRYDLVSGLKSIFIAYMRAC